MEPLPLYNSPLAPPPPPPQLAQLQRARHSLTRQEEREGRSRLAAKLERWQCNVEMQATASAERARQHRQLAQDKKRAQVHTHSSVAWCDECAWCDKCVM